MTDKKPTLAELRAEASRLTKALQSTREQLAHHCETVSAGLSATRSYAFSATSSSRDAVVAGCADSLERNGFCVIDDVIPADNVAAIRDEVEQAESTIADNVQALREILDGAESDVATRRDLLQNAVGTGVELRRARRVGYPPKPPNDIVWMPLYAERLAHPVVTAVARRVLDDHLKIAQLHLRPIAADQGGTPGGFGPERYRGRADTREWLMDWPHDLSAYGGDNPALNAGRIRQPFPDVAMCLVMIWYLTDVDADSGGTWVVGRARLAQGQAKSARAPCRWHYRHGAHTRRSAGGGQSGFRFHSGFTYLACVGHAQSRTKAHSGRQSLVSMVAVRERLCARRDLRHRPLSHDEYRALPADLQPFMRHLCPDELDTLQQPVLDRAEAAAAQTRWGYQQVEENPESLAHANAHVRVPVF